VRRGSIVQLVLIGIVSGAIATCIAVLVPWMPTTASDQADRIDFTYWFATVISLFVFAVVAAILIYALINFRVKDPNDWSDGPPIHGHTTIEVVWTVIPAILVTAIAIVSAVVLAQNGNAGDRPLKVNVVAQQFAWQFSYDGGKTYYPILRLPLDRKAQLILHANDVIHSFWVPQFAQKQDLVPGTTQTLVITPNQEGSWPVVCTELCGLGHSLMRSQAVVWPAARFDAWLKQQSKPGGGAGGGGRGGASGQAIFESKGCGACHSFSAVPSAKGQVGPSLDNLTEAAKTAGEPLEDYIRESIVDPNAKLAAGFNPPSAMPSFKDTITGADLDALVKFLADNTK
jgi:cytochrome c oxidase subunit 2